MRDSRLGQAGALVDDARCLIADIAEEGWPLGLGPEARRKAIAERAQLNVVRAHLNRAIEAMNKVEERDE